MGVQPTTLAPWATAQQDAGKGVIDGAIRETQSQHLGRIVRTSFGDHALSTTGGLVTSDLTVKQDVEAELQWEPGGDAAGIRVAVKEGIVTLTGRVATSVKKYAAARAAAPVVRVKAVANDLEVGPHSRLQAHGA